MKHMVLLEALATFGLWFFAGSILGCLMVVLGADPSWIVTIVLVVLVLRALARNLAATRGRP